MNTNHHHRQIITYDEKLGHKYVSDLFTRLRYGNDGYFIETDDLGFRNSKQKAGKIKIIVLGDSYVAGDGVSNSSRFSDVIAENLDCEVINLGVSGYGVDQQILAYEQFKDQIEHDIVIFAPYLEDFYRNLIPAREGLDKSTGKSVLVPKPYYNIENGSLALQNIPVPRERIIIDEEKRVEQRGNILSEVYDKLRPAFYKLKYEALGKQDFPELNDRKSKEWIMMSLLIEKLKNLTASKKLIIAPIPFNSYVTRKQKQLYLTLFNEYQEDESVWVIDLLSDLLSSYEQGNDDLFLKLCGHFSPIGHKIVAKTFELFLENDLNIKRRAISAPVDQKPNKNYILGISCYYHDAAAAILENGVVVAAAQEERFTRKKHDPSMPVNAINYCLEEVKIKIDDLDGICYYDNEAWTLERVLHNAESIGHKGQEFWERAKKSMLKKIMLSGDLKKTLNYSGPIYKTEHHISHAASAYYPSPFMDAAILVVDGVGEWACSTIAKASPNGISILKQQDYPHSLGLLYSAFTYFCGFKVNSGEYKLMGLAPYGDPVYVDRIKEYLIDIKTDGSIFLNLGYFSFMEGERMTNEAFSELFDGPERLSESQISVREMNLAASIQKVTEEVIIRMANHAFELCGCKNLVFAGGVALNCVANGKLFEESLFDDIWIQPASGDAGGALGAAFDLYYNNFCKTGKKEDSIQKDSYLGPSYSENEIFSFLHTKGIPYHKFQVNQRQNEIAEFVSNKNIIGYFDGRMEFGPRALGARSIIADPTDIEMQSKLNLRIKYRESFRPFAPMVMEEELANYFDFNKPSPYMLIVSPVKKELRVQEDHVKEMGEDMIKKINLKRSQLPAITHVDYSARLQSVSKQSNPYLHDILKKVKEHSSYATLINTSFNVRGEPIVCTPDDAFKCFMRTEMDVLVLGDFFLLKEEQPKWEENENWEDLFTLD